MLSYWERESFCSYDHIIVGAGIVGISTAIELQTAYPQARVLVLERGLLPTGASTRNAGFACMGSVTELLADLKNSTEEEVATLFLQRRYGLALLRQRVSDAAIGYGQDGGYELISPEDVAALDQMAYLNRLLRPYIHTDAFRLANDRLEEFGFARSKVAALIENTCEAGINTGRAMRSLHRIAVGLGIEIMTGAELKSFEESSHEVQLRVADPFRKEDLLLRAATLSICTNAFSKALLPDADLRPGRGQVLVTKPVPNLRFKGIFHFDSGYYYFREIDGRVLIGGGRNLDFEAEATTDMELTPLIQEDLESRLREVILPGQPFEVDLRWAGIMAFGKTKQPIVKAVSNRVFAAMRMGGMGVALGSQAARDLAALIMQRN